MLRSWGHLNRLRGTCWVLSRVSQHAIVRTKRLPSRNALCSLSTFTPGCSQLSPRQRRKDILPTPDTIYALSTAPGRAAIAIIRISGPACLDIYGGLCPDKAFPHPRYATLRKLVDPTDNTRVLDTSALVFYFPPPNTVTGEPLLEFHVHGGPAIVRSILDAIPRCTDTRPRRRNAEYSIIRAAEPGEFTKRAFYNGRLDLTEAEALGETLSAETEQQRRLAIAGVNSGLATRYEGWRKMLLNARGELEALIDFSEDQHFDESPAEFMGSVASQVAALRKEIVLHVTNANRGELLRGGISVALLGAPNAGKSSLLNRIVGREAAIVSSEAGTTRDIVDVTIDIGGWLVRLGDMAGLRRTTLSGRIDTAANSDTDVGMIEQEGIRRARERALQSDLIIVLVSLVRLPDSTVDLVINPELLSATQDCYDAGKSILFVINKTDLITGSDRGIVERNLRTRILASFPPTSDSNIFFLSCKDALRGAEGFAPAINKYDPGGVQFFLQGLTATFSAMTTAVTGESSSDLTPSEAQSYWTTSLSVTQRQSAYLQDCLEYLEEFLSQNRTVENEGTEENHVESNKRLSHHVDGHDDLVGEIIPTQHIDDRLSIVVTDNDTHHNQGFDVFDKDEFDIVTAAEHLRYAAVCLAKITGRGEGGDVEDVLGVVFEK